MENEEKGIVEQRTKLDIARGMETSLSIGGVRLRNFEDLLAFGNALIDSKFCPKGFERGSQVVSAIALAEELGMKPIQSIQRGLYIEPRSGRLSYYVEWALAVLRKSGALLPNDRKEITGEGENLTVTWHFQRPEWKQPKAESYSLARARKSGLIRSDSQWERDPIRMLWWRAVGFAIKDWFSDVMAGGAIQGMSEDAAQFEIVPPGGVTVTGGPETSVEPGSDPALAAIEAVDEVVLEVVPEGEGEPAPPDPPQATPAPAPPPETKTRKRAKKPEPAKAEKPKTEHSRLMLLTLEAQKRVGADDDAALKDLLSELHRVHKDEGIDAAEAFLRGHPVFGDEGTQSELGF